MPDLQTSPYTSPMAKISFGPNKKCYYISRDFMNGYKCFDSSSNEFNCSFGEDVGHVMVHFMYTGQYQTLESISSKENSEEKARNKFQTALQVLMAADRYKFTELEVLTKSEIQDLSNSIHIFDRVKIVDQQLSLRDDIHFKLSKEWITGFLLEGLRQAYEKDETEFENLTILLGLHNTEFIKDIATGLFQIYYQKGPRSRITNIYLPEVKSEETESITASILTPKTISGDEGQSSSVDGDSMTLC